MDQSPSALLERCKGFSMADAGLRKQLLADLERSDSLKLLPSLHAKGGLTIENIESFIKLGSAAALQEALVGLSIMMGSSIEASADPTDSARKKDLITMAAMGAACHLGRDCSPQAFESLLQCASAGLCSGNIFVTRQESVSEDDWKTIERYRLLLVHAVKTKDLKTLVEQP